MIPCYVHWIFFITIWIGSTKDQTCSQSKVIWVAINIHYLYHKHLYRLSTNQSILKYSFEIHVKPIYSFSQYRLCLYNVTYKLQLLIINRQLYYVQDVIKEVCTWAVSNDNQGNNKFVANNRNVNLSITFYCTDLEPHSIIIVGNDHTWILSLLNIVELWLSRSFYNSIPELPSYIDTGLIRITCKQYCKTKISANL